VFKDPIPFLLILSNTSSIEYLELKIVFKQLLICSFSEIRPGKNCSVNSGAGSTYPYPVKKDISFISQILSVASSKV